MPKGKKEKKEPKKNGRPTKFTQKLADDICFRISNGESLRHICKDEKIPTAATICNWLLDIDKRGFFEQYNRARNVQAELIFEELLDIADDGTNDLMMVGRPGHEFEKENTEVTNRSKLRVETRKWYLSKVLPKKFGEKLDLTSDGKPLPTPIMAIPDVHTDNSDKKDSSAQGEN